MAQRAHLRSSAISAVTSDDMIGHPIISVRGTLGCRSALRVDGSAEEDIIELLAR